MNRPRCIADRGLPGSVRAFVVLSLILLVGACAPSRETAGFRVGGIAGLLSTASRETYQTQLEGWVGKTKAELVEQFGPPQRSDEGGDGKEILIWSSSSEMSQGTSAPVGGGFSIGIGTTSENTCELSFTLVDGVAESFDWKFYASTIFGKIKPLGSGECNEAFPATPRG